MARNRLKTITRSIWWSVVIGGTMSILFGLFATFWPGLTLATLTLMFGVFVVVMGAVWLVESLASVKSDPLWWLGLLLSALAIALGVYLFTNPSTTLLVFVILLAMYVFAQAILDFIIASYAPKGDRWPWIFTGIIGLLFGAVIVMQPRGATLALIWILGVYMVARGLLSVIYAGRAKKFVNRIGGGGTKRKTTPKVAKTTAKKKTVTSKKTTKK